MLFILLVLSKLKNVESHEISRRDRWSISTVLPILIKGRDKDSRDEAALEDLYILSVTDEEYPVEIEEEKGWWANLKESVINFLRWLGIGLGVCFLV